MKIITAQKQVRDLQQIRIKDRKPVIDDAAFVFGKIDKNALEAAVRLKEEYGGEVIVVSAGNEELEDTVKEALAADADRALLIADNLVDEMSSEQIARLLAELIKQIEGYDLILFGEGSGDNYSGQIGSRVAELLDLPQAGYIDSIHIDGDMVIVKRCLEDQDEILKLELPAVLMIAADCNEPRIPAVSKVLKAGRKPKELFSLDDLSIDPGKPQVLTISNLAPLNNRKGVKLNNLDELLDILKSEQTGGK